VSGATVPDDLRLTPQRRAVLDVLADADDHPTAGDVLARVRDRVPGVGAATVYRTLARLVETGQALELHLGQGAPTRYDRNTGQHDHLICDGCGRVLDVRLPLAPARLRDAAASYGFALRSYDVRIHGRCDRCTDASTST
jgi:Fe2+ or Zn2+ uptake regulation protein